MVMAPLFVKYRDRDGQGHVYDVGSGEILRVGNTVYEVLDDYHVLTHSEMCAKHSRLPEKELYDALEQLDELQSMNVLSDHMPAPTYAARRIICDGESEPIRDFINHRRRLLTLEVTHRCNLACEYCCYGKHYSYNRDDSQAVMSLDTAEKAIRQFIVHTPKEACIGFYGGEALLELGLMEEIVLFAEALAESDGKDVQFSMTTNGTLLTDKAIHFLVKHRVLVMISIDGNREAHDRYRVFKTMAAAEERKGSYDVIVKNMKRFVELYPDYLGRGLVLTLTATSDFDEAEEFIQLWKPDFRTVSVSLVTDIRRNSEMTDEDHPAGLGCGHFSPCGDGFCGREQCAEGDGGSSRDESFSADCDKCSRGPDFDSWSEEFWQRQHASRASYLIRLCQTGDGDAAHSIANASEINRTCTNANVRIIHNRSLLGKGKKSFPPSVRLACLPGASRTYCSTTGVLYSCEKTEFGEPFIIGNVEDDVDPEKAHRLADILRLHCDCGNCVLDRLCLLCPALISESTDHPGRIDSLGIRKACKDLSSKAVFSERLGEYTGIMEANPSVLDWLEERLETDDDDWLNRLRVDTDSPKKMELPVEELEEYV
ncbi:MAG: radical SAM protein [Planctomycetes bacterium]|nr:radical SAM protein [Planctomycetota bacterium]